MQNPWIALPRTSPFVLASDADLLNAFNATASPRHRYDLSLLPEPFFGSPSAPVVVLNLNPGWDAGDAEVHAREDFSVMARDSLGHNLQPYPFLHLQPTTSSPGGRWWRQRVRYLIQDVGFESVAKRLACVQFTPYHSSEYSNSSPRLPSQAYSFNLVRNAMTRGAEIVVMRSKRLWFEAVPELASYERIHIGSNPRAPFVSPGNLKESYASIAQRLR